MESSSCRSKSITLAKGGVGSAVGSTAISTTNFVKKPSLQIVIFLSGGFEKNFKDSLCACLSRVLRFGFSLGNRRVVVS